MWVTRLNALVRTKDSIPGRLVSNRVNFYSGSSKLEFRSASLATGAMMYQAVRRVASGRPIRLVTYLPGAEPRDAQLQVAAALFSDLWARQRESGVPMICGDVLLVTRNLRDGVAFLRNLSIARSASLTDVWEIQTVAAYEPPKVEGSQARVWVVSPAHRAFLNDFPGRFAAVVVDGSHPSIQEQMSTFLSIPALALAPLQMILIPPSAMELVPPPAKDAMNLCWLWDPAGESAVAGEELSTKETRCYWVCDDGVVQDFESIHQSLVALTRASRGGGVSRLGVGWALYHRLRTLVVPLGRLEGLRNEQPFTPTLAAQLESMKGVPEVDEALRPIYDVHWPRLYDGLERAYERMRDLSEPPKFWALANAVEEIIRQGGSASVVVPSRDDAALLGQLLCELVDGVQSRLESGQLQLITTSQEVSIPFGQTRVLPGLRRSSDLQLDVFTGGDVHVIAYPYERDLDRKRVTDGYQRMLSLQQNAVRETVFDALGIPAVKNFDMPPVTSAPDFQERICGVVRLREEKELEFEPFVLEWRQVAISLEGERANRVAPIPACMGETISVYLGDGEILHFTPERHVYVYYAVGDEVRRTTAETLQPGDHLILLADDLYEDLFERLIEGLDNLRPQAQTLQLRFWQLVKRTALSRHTGRCVNLYQWLAAQGLGVNYETVTRWFREGEAEIIAPQSREDFLLLAAASGLTSDQSLMEELWIAVQDERVNRRRLGSFLKNSLLALFGRQVDRNVLRQATSLEATVEDVINLVILRRVKEVRRSSLDRPIWPFERGERFAHGG